MHKLRISLLRYLSGYWALLFVVNLFSSFALLGNNRKMLNSPGIANFDTFFKCVKQQWFKILFSDIFTSEIAFKIIVCHSAIFTGLSSIMASCVKVI